MKFDGFIVLRFLSNTAEGIVAPGLIPYFQMIDNKTMIPK